MTATTLDLQTVRAELEVTQAELGTLLSPSAPVYASTISRWERTGVYPSWLAVAIDGIRYRRQVAAMHRFNADSLRLPSSLKPSGE